MCADLLRLLLVDHADGVSGPLLLRRLRSSTSLLTRMARLLLLLLLLGFRLLGLDLDLDGRLIELRRRLGRQNGRVLRRLGGGGLRLKHGEVLDVFTSKDNKFVHIRRRRHELSRSVLCSEASHVLQRDGCRLGVDGVEDSLVADVHVADQGDASADVGDAGSLLRLRLRLRGHGCGRWLRLVLRLRRGCEAAAVG
jgi:hypothetical protein